MPAAGSGERGRPSTTALGDEDAARQVFERLAAGPDLARIEALTGLTRSKAGCG